MRFRTILADPPWKYGDKLRQDPLVDRGADDHYETMTVDEICALAKWNIDRVRLADAGVKTIAGFEVDDPAFLFLWVTNGMLLDGSGPRVARAWGFEPKQLVTWVKVKEEWAPWVDHVVEKGLDVRDLGDLNSGALQFGMGRITRGVTEQMIVATRGQYTDEVLSHSERNVLFAPRTTHSRKPEVQYALIERIVPGPYLELFATQRREGWTSWGNGL